MILKSTRHRFLGLSCFILMGLLVLIILGCDESYLPNPVAIYCSLYADGTGFQQGDERLYNSTWGKPFYVSEDIVFHLKSKIYRRELNSNNPTQIIPDSLLITDQTNMVIDLQNQKLWFSANGDIYRCNFSGGELSNFSSEIYGILTAPTLSSCGNYLTAILDGQICCLDLQNRTWQLDSRATNVSYAVYISDLNEFYYFGKGSTNQAFALYRLPQSAAEPEQIFTQSGTDASYSWGVSYDSRYFALLPTKNSDWNAYVDKMLIFDRLEGDTIQIDKCFSFAFSAIDSRICYSRSTHGMADLNILELDSGEDEMIWDGYLSQSTYSFSVSSISWRADGEHLFYQGKKGYRTDHKQSNGYANPFRSVQPELYEN